MEKIMAVNVMLTIDLNRYATTEQRSKFYDELRKRNWVKIAELTTTWKAVFSEGVSVETAKQSTKSMLDAAAIAASISSYDAAAMYGGQDPVILKKP